MNLKAKARELVSSAKELVKKFQQVKGYAYRCGLSYADLPFDWRSIEVVRRTVEAIQMDSEPSSVWVRHVGHEIDRLMDILEEFEEKAATMVTVRQVVDVTDLERARRRLQPKKYFGRNRTEPVRIRIGLG